LSSSLRTSKFANWAGYNSTLVGWDMDFSESTLSSCQGPPGSQDSPYTNYHGSTLSVMSEDTILDGGYAGAFNDYENPLPFACNETPNPDNLGHADKGLDDCC
jgi:hypothetical protein